MHTKCSVKYVSALELLLGSVLTFEVLHIALLASSIIFRCVFSLSNPVPRADSFSIAMRS
jgi:hypothetical protein